MTAQGTGLGNGKRCDVMCDYRQFALDERTCHLFVLTGRVLTHLCWIYNICLPAVTKHGTREIE